MLISSHPDLDDTGIPKEERNGERGREKWEEERREKEVVAVGDAHNKRKADIGLVFARQ